MYDFPFYLFVRFVALVHPFCSPVFAGINLKPAHSRFAQFCRFCREYYLNVGLSLTLKAPRKPASANVVCLCRLLNILANFSNLFFAYRQTVWTQIRLLKEQSDLGPHCLQK